ncbi:hypothetical protein [Nonomuraea basaltis]|uniref:hypothetical protein n=1 Tax=Nonomuraea basaltis TaxID=2495887 RepID=UPI00110C55F8|nr:hypothetical protein [Nonomuraea basaltis]TMR96094.1 hypothetical protein EJK15_25115 [Nonomuraea basaltis]
MKAVIAALLMAPLLLNPTPGPREGTTQEKEESGNTRGWVGRDTGVNVRVDAGGGKSDGYRIPRPCWYEPGPSPQEMLDRFSKGRDAANRARIDEGNHERFLEQFRDKLNKPGQWWTPAYNEADPNHVACMADLDPFGVFVPPGQTPPSGITIEQLAQIARAALTVPEPTVKLSPDAKSYVNLPTWVWLEGIGEPRRTVTAELPGVMSVTLVATLQDIRIDPGTTPERAEVTESGCGAAGKPYTSGGTFSCGVRYLRSSIDQPREQYTLTVTTVWPVEIQAQGNVVPFQFTPVQLETTRDVSVGEIQSNVKPSAD